jgi:hypothetical protein
MRRGVIYSINYGIGSPSISGSATKFSLGGTTPYSDALFVKSAIGRMPNSVIYDTNGEKCYLCVRYEVLPMSRAAHTPLKHKHHVIWPRISLRLKIEPLETSRFRRYRRSSPANLQVWRLSFFPSQVRGEDAPDIANSLRTRVLFRFSESQQASLQLGTEAEAVFRMLKKPKRDVFEFSDGRQITLGDLPVGLIFDVLVVPGSEQLSTILEPEPAVQHHEDEREKEPFLVRLLTRF